ncbi:MAG TPA: isochorismatase family cysteine hydrolase [Bacteroidales bacterium]|nr:isochorismatase family cysteine hydrolase [Bacteroidales bacterium]
MKKSFFLMCFFLMLACVMPAQDNNQMSPALLVIDVQKKYVPMMSEDDRESALKTMNWSIWLFRQYELPVIRIYHTSEKYGPAPGTEEFAFHDSLKVMESDPMIIKTYGSGFNKTELDSLLKAEGINTLFMCGLSSTGCVLATYMDASNYDYKAFLVKGALLGPTSEYTRQVEDMFDAISLNTANFILKQKE